MKTTGSPQELASLYKRMAAAMAQLKRLPKRGRNERFNYAYVTDSDVLDAVRSALGSAGIGFFTDVVDIDRSRSIPTRSGELAVTELTVDAMFADSETGATVTVTWLSEAMDGQDKGINKALTGAVKYGLLKTLLISTGEDDPDDEAQPEDKGNGQKAEDKDDGRKRKPKRPMSPEFIKEHIANIVESGNHALASEAQRGLIASKMEECFAGDSEAKQKRYKVTWWLSGITSTGEMTKAHADGYLKWLLAQQEKDDTGDYPLHPKAPVEAAAIYREALKDEGQPEFAELTQGPPDA